MTLLVTGATGHVGGEIVRQAMKRDMPVIAVARDAVGEAEAQACSVRQMAAMRSCRHRRR